MRSSILAPLALILTVPAFATDGVLEISHTCAQTGCFSGDVAGYPITLDGTNGRSYRLTSDLIVPDENTNGLLVISSNQSIDLNGFEIVRSGCEGATIDCTLAGSGIGIEKPDGVIVRGISVSNGTITGMGRSGIRLNTQSHISGVRLRWNGATGIVVGVGSIVSGNTVLQNRERGIQAGNGSLISDNVILGNGRNGIEASSNTTISGNSVTDNGYGTAIAGLGFGLVLDAASAYRDNTIAGNREGSVSGGVNAGGNVCNGSLTCP